VTEGIASTFDGDEMSADVAMFVEDDSKPEFVKPTASTLIG
jgi:hypothetical protein